MRLPILPGLLLLLLPAGGCAPTVPLAEHEALQDDVRTIGERLDTLEAENDRLKVMVATQRQIIRDMRCNASLVVEPDPDLPVP